MNRLTNGYEMNLKRRELTTQTKQNKKLKEEEIIHLLNIQDNEIHKTVK